jgi:hypothetical protein
MFTARLVFPDGNSNIFEVRRVEWLEKPIMKADGGIDIDRGLLLHYEDGGYAHYGKGSEGLRVFVMNREGSTVANFLL